MMVALAGGIGGSKLLMGLQAVVPVEELVVIANTGDDFEHFGLRICPDLDTVTYTLGGHVDPKSGWGRDSDTFNCLRGLEELGAAAWFQLGDRDLATHLFRTQLLRDGVGLAEVTRRLARRLGVQISILPATESYHPTLVMTSRGVLHIQEYLVRERCRPQLRGFLYQEIESARPAPGVVEALDEADVIVICPSNPIISIGPILSVPGIRAALRRSSALRIVVTPIVAGRALKGPAAKMMGELGMAVSPLGVARLYQDFTDIFVTDQKDAALKPRLEALGLRARLTDTVMTSLESKISLARKILELA